MAATPSIQLETAHRRTLLETAARAIESQLGIGAAGADPDVSSLPAALGLPAATFVTLQSAAGLRGCCGTLEARRPLVLDVWLNARASAFGDPRFEPLEQWEWQDITELEIAVICGFEPWAVSSEAELLRRLEPGIDGLVLAWRGQRATFLPKVWEQLPEPVEFIRRLKVKAGWSTDFWAPDIEVLRYETATFSLQRPAGRRTSGQPT